MHDHDHIGQRASDRDGEGDGGVIAGALGDALRSSDDRLRLATQAARLVWWEIDVGSRKHTVADNYAEVLGFEPRRRSDDVMTAIGTFVAPDDLDDVVAAFESVLGGEGDLLIEYRVVNPESGDIVWLESSATLLRDEATGADRVVGVSRNISERKRAEEALHESESRLRLTLDAAGFGSWVWDPVHDISVVDERTLALLGLPPGDPARFADVLGGRIHPDDRGRYRAAVERACDPAGTGELREEIRILDADGDERWLAVFGQSISTGTPRRAVRMHGLLVDVTERKCQEAALEARIDRERFHVALADAVRPLVDPADVRAEAARVLGQRLGATRVLFGEIDESGEVLVVGRHYVAGLPQRTGRLRMTDFSAAHLDAVRRGDVLLSDDVMVDERVTDAGRESFARLGITAVAAVPLVKSGELVAVLVALDGTARRWTATEVELMRETAERTWAAVQHARAETELRASEGRYRSLFETIAEGFCVMERIEADDEDVDEYRYLEANPAFERHTGLRSVVGRTVGEVLPAIRTDLVRIFDRVIATGEPRDLEARVPSLDRWFDLHVSLVPGERERVAVVFSDISARKAAEEAMRRANEDLEERVEARTQDLHRLARRLTMAEQEERRRISQVLHDDLQQILYAVDMKMEVVGDSLEAMGRPGLVQGLDDARAWVAQAVETTRHLTVDLSPLILQQEGLVDALEWLQRQMRDLHGLDVTIDADHRFFIDDEDLRVFFFQIVRELLFNVKKHAGTELATVQIRERPGADGSRDLVIRVADEGCGFDADIGPDGPGGYGLFSIRERLRFVGGHMDIRSSAGGGTEIELVAPLRTADHG
jgi:PAS domain S-box-containing protein